MKNKMMKILAGGLMSLVISASGTAVFANPTDKKAGEKASVAAARKHPKTVKITVTKDGFNPSSIRAEKGYPLTLIFYRADNKGCGKEVVFESLNIRKKLPLKKNVRIVITPQETGEIAFACGMGMMKGSIVAH
ncbi:MAG: cupredoxin domain-containing protein [Acidobacteria bacterium]|nr:cupredoxin domain-containing protein [Acidobacteriota bacterium]